MNNLAGFIAYLAGLLLKIYDQDCKILKRVARLEYHTYNDHKNIEQELIDNMMVFSTEKNELNVKSREFTIIK